VAISSFLSHVQNLHDPDRSGRVVLVKVGSSRSQGSSSFSPFSFLLFVRASRPTIPLGGRPCYSIPFSLPFSPPVLFRKKQDEGNRALFPSFPSSFPVLFGRRGSVRRAGISSFPPFFSPPSPPHPYRRRCSGLQSRRLFAFHFFLFFFFLLTSTKMYPRAALLFPSPFLFFFGRGRHGGKGDLFPFFSLFFLTLFSPPPPDFQVAGKAGPFFFFFLFGLPAA